jgi:Putative zinc-finger
VTRHDPDVDELTRYLDGEVSENRAAAIREHLAGCAGCRDVLELERQLVADLAAPVAFADAELVAGLVRRLDAAPARRAAPRWLWPSCATVATLGAVLAVFVATRSPDDAGELHARGGDHSGEPAASAIARRVGLAVYSISPDRARLGDGSRVAPGTAYALSYRNRHDEPLYVLAFAVDSQDAIHWLAPGYVDPSTDPLAAPFPRSDHETMFSDAVVFDDIPTGRLRIVTIVSPMRERISAVERLPATELSRAALAARWNDAVVREVTVEVTRGGYR